jgi:serine/threonine protein kinase
MPRYPAPGIKLLGKYRVESLIGEGGMGAVVKAMHIDLDEAVAIKVLLPDLIERKEIVQRFLREAKAAVKLKGEHVARVIDVGRFEEQPFADVPYIVMEYLDGADLNAIIKHHGAQDPEVAVDLILQACQAIAEAHSLGIIHRDIKASNFFITQTDGGAPQLKVLDFGIATAPQGVSELTDAQAVIGTPAYMAPEQMRAARIADQRSDIWSMGVVLYELLEGTRPFRSDVYSDLCLKVGMDPPCEMVNPAVPEALRAVVFKCLEKPIERRYQSVAELAFDLMPFASDPVMARAAVEQCARLLGRRSTRSFDAVRVPDDATPIGAPLMRLTPPSHHRAVVAPIIDKTPAGATSLASSRPSGALRSLTPVPGMGVQRTPTSVGGSNGEIAHDVSLVRPPRKLLLAASFVGAAVIGIGVGVVYFTASRGGDQPSAPAAPAPAAITEPAPAPEPVSPPPKPAATAPEPAKPAETPPPEPPSESAKATAKVAKPVHPPVVVVHPHPKPPPAPPPPPPPKKPPASDDAYTRRQ